MNSSLTHGQNLHAEREFFRAQDAEADRKLPEIASRLHNGSTVLAAKHGRPARGGEVQCIVVLGFHGGAGAVQPFATWLVRPGGDAVWGHYFDNLFDAVRDYAERS